MKIYVLLAVIELSGCNHYKFTYEAYKEAKDCISAQKKLTEKYKDSDDLKTSKCEELEVN